MAKRGSKRVPKWPNPWIPGVSTPSGGVRTPFGTPREHLMSTSRDPMGRDPYPQPIGMDTPLAPKGLQMVPKGVQKVPKRGSDPQFRPSRARARVYRYLKSIPRRWVGTPIWGLAHPRRSTREKEREGLAP